jgi:tRNA wybutosine-synthesizing protein 3
MSSSLPTSFITKKVRILEALSVPDTEYGDLSPKGSIDKAIRGLIDDINELDGYVTTSSCAGRIAVFLEGKKKDEEHYEEIEKYGGNGGDEDGPEREEVADSAGIEDSPESEPNPKSTKAGIGGKGGGGHWLYVSHESVIIDAYYGYLAPLLGMQRVSEDTSRELARVLSLGLGIETSAAPLYSSNTGKRRYIHFKFEPMVCYFLSWLRVVV